MADFPLEYQGPEQTYKPYIDTATREGRSVSSGIGQGYADIDFLREKLEEFGLFVKEFYDLCVAEMGDYTLLLDTSDQTLIKSHQMCYPNDDTPDSISFKEYIYNFSASKTTSSQYVNKYYENKVRGAYGTNALDFAHVSRIAYSEVKRIENFLDEYTGEIDDPSEYRILETFQDWIQNAENLFTKFRQAFQIKAVAEIPGEELAELTETKAREFQGLFQSKLNVINVAINDILGQLYKDWDLVADPFYSKILGPSLKFNLNISRSITNGLDSTAAPTLYAEASMTKLGLEGQFQAALSDQVKRNNLFYKYCEAIVQNVVQRDVYVKYLRQLMSKGKILPNPFITQLDDEPDEIKNISTILQSPQPLNYDDNASSDHSYLTGSDSPDAHPQYLLRSGGQVVGVIDINGGLHINGARLEDIVYLENGITKVPSSAIDWDGLNGSIGNALPSDLYVINRKVRYDAKIEYTVEFDVDDTDVVGYEFEIIAVDTGSVVSSTTTLSSWDFSEWA